MRSTIIIPAIALRRQQTTVRKQRAVERSTGLIIPAAGFVAQWDTRISIICKLCQITLRLSKGGRTIPITPILTLRLNQEEKVMGNPGLSLKYRTIMTTECQKDGLSVRMELSASPYFRPANVRDGTLKPNGMSYD